MKPFLGALILVFTFNFSIYNAQHIILKPPVSENSIPQQGKKYKVVKVKDGDTVVILVENRALSVRLNHIDCPEKKQAFASKAKQFVSDACFGQYITLIHRQKYDRYGRLIAEIILPNGKNLNKELVKNGLAWHFIKYSTDMEYAKLELMARRKKINIWSAPYPTAPWNWRKTKQ